MKKRILLLFLLMAGISINNRIWAQTGDDYGDFPFEESYLSKDQPDHTTIVSTTSGGQTDVKFTESGVQLTQADQNAFGGIFINDRRFNARSGIVVDFEYMMYGGTGGDGLSIFFFDNEVVNPTIGAKGAGIGYAFNRIWHDRTGYWDFEKFFSKGLSGGYLGIAFDIPGNFKAARFQGDARVNGIPFGDQYSDYYESKYNGKHDVTIRGAVGKPISNYTGTEEGYTGYPVLIAQTTKNIVSGDVNENNYFVLDSTNGRYVRKSTEHNSYRPAANMENFNFTISSGEEFKDSSDLSYRKAHIELFPIYNADSTVEEGFFITVNITHGSVTDTVINNYEYRGEIKYLENTLSPSTQNSDYITDGDKEKKPRIGVLQTIDATPPEFLRIGFAASTGDKTNIHTIKNLKISMLHAAEAEDDTISINGGYPLLNDKAYDGPVKQQQTPKTENVDPNSFQFIYKENKYTDKCVVPGQGTWIYDPDKAFVRFVPEIGFTGEATIDYNIKGKGDPYGRESHRSIPATIVVNVPTGMSTRVLTNKMVTSRPR